MVPMMRALFVCAVAAGLEAARVETEEGSASNGTSEEGAKREGCEWAYFNTLEGWSCMTLKKFTSGAWGDTRMVAVKPKRGQQSYAVLKVTTSNPRDGALELLVNERIVAGWLQSHHFQHMPSYRFDFPMQNQFRKYKDTTLTWAERLRCDQATRFAQKCKLHADWDICNGKLPDTMIDTVSPQHDRTLMCPDAEALLMWFLDGYSDISFGQNFLVAEDLFKREVRAAAMFLAYNDLRQLHVAHCDISNENVMFKLEDPTEMKFIDFGQALLNDPDGRCQRGSLEGPFEFRLPDVGRGGQLWNVYQKVSGGKEFQADTEEWQPISSMCKEMELQASWGNVVAYSQQLVQKWRELHG